MKKSLILIALIVCFVQAHAQYTTREYIRRYHLALTLTSPLSGTFKYGIGLEDRWRNFAYMYSYVNYYHGLYPGTEQDLEIRVYLRKMWRNGRYNVLFQNFIYARGMAGTAGYDGSNVTIFGYNDKGILPATDYVGGSAGVGRRYNKGVLFVTIRGGVRVIELPDLPPPYKNSYRIFYFTGPGSILEANLQFGIQI